MVPSSFIENILQKHKSSDRFPPTSMVSNFTTQLLLVLFPEQCKNRWQEYDELEGKFATLCKDLTAILETFSDRLALDVDDVAQKFWDQIPEVYRLLLTDVKAIMDGDPAATSEYEVIRAYPGFYAIFFYRIAHTLYQLEIPVVPRIITEYAHSKTGIDIHPGATIGENFFIDHGTGIVIGETVIIGDRVKMYQGVTLGALSVAKDMANTKRHPTVEDDVVIYSGATILGGETVVGKGSIIGGNVWLTKSIPAETTIYHQAQTKIRNEQ